MSDDIFYANLSGTRLISDIRSIELPIYSLSTNAIEHKQRIIQLNRRKIIVSPNDYGRPTICDKRFIWYVGGQILAAIDHGIPTSPHIMIHPCDFFKVINRGDGSKQYDAVLASIRRLRGTTIEVISDQNKYNSYRNFSLLSEAEVSYSKFKNQPISIKIRLADCIYNEIISGKVISFNEEYLSISSPLVARLYEIFEKQAGVKDLWKIKLEILHKWSGSLSPQRTLKHQFKKGIIKVPGFSFKIDERRDPSIIGKRTGSPRKRKTW